MNWENAKNWLLSLFLILDVLLGWQLYSSRQMMNGYVENETDLLANTKTLLAEHGFKLAADVPDNQPDLASFQAKSASPTLNVLAKAIFPHASALHYSDQIGQVSTDSGQLSVTAQGTWAVTFTKPQGINDKRDPRTYAYQGDSYVSDAVTSTNKHRVFMQTYKSYAIFDARLITTQTANSLMSYTQTELSGVSPTSDPKPVISAMDALNSLANSVDKSNQTDDNKILKVDLGFARKVPLYQVSASNNYWFPVWRVVTPDETYYVNAFTGEVELAP